MTVADWLASALADAERRGDPDLAAALRTLAAATEQLRGADWDEDAAGPTPDDGDREAAR